MQGQTQRGKETLNKQQQNPFLRMDFSFSQLVGLMYYTDQTFAKICCCLSIMMNTRIQINNYTHDPKIVIEYDQEIPHNHKLQTTPRHREDEPLDHHETPGRQIKQSNQLGPPQPMGITSNIRSTTTEPPPQAIGVGGIILVPNLKTQNYLACNEAS